MLKRLIGWFRRDVDFKYDERGFSLRIWVGDAHGFEAYVDRPTGRATVHVFWDLFHAN